MEVNSLTCETCKWADDFNQPDGVAICRANPPTATMLPSGAIGTAWPRISLAHDFCRIHEPGRSKIRLVKDLPGQN